MPFEYEVFTIEVPWKAGQTPEEWPYLPAQEIISANMNRLGESGNWEVFQTVHGPRPSSESIPQKVNLWGRRQTER